MAANLVSPGVNIREVDLTSGSVTASTVPVGGFVGPFQKGPVDLPVLIQNENELLKVFGAPVSTNGQSEYWLSASNFLSYGGALRVVRSNCSAEGSLVNSNSGVGIASTSVQINSLEDYNNQSNNSYYYASRNPGSWANGLKVCTIDAFADQTLGIGTFGIEVGYGVTAGINTSLAGLGTVTNESGFLKAIVTGINAGSIDVKIVSRYRESSGTYVNVEYAENTINSFKAQQSIKVFDTNGSEVLVEKSRFTGSTTNGVGIITSITGTLSNGDIIASVDNAAISGVATVTSYNSSIGIATMTQLAAASVNNGSFVALTNDPAPLNVLDWYNSQKLGIENSTVYWKNIAPKPKTTQYASERSSRNDQINVVVIDDNGSVTGTASNIIEKFVGLSKAYDAKTSPSQAIYYRDYIANNSEYIFPGASEEGIATGFGMADDFSSGSVSNWGLTAQGNTFASSGNKTYTLLGGTDYSDGTNSYNVSLPDVISSYSIFKNPTQYQIDFLICGPSGGADEFESQAKAEELISIAENRKDCIAVISPHKASVVNVSNSDKQTDNIIKFFNLSSSSYAVFDSGYKYAYDKFNNEFIYVACNSDVAGLMARTTINQFPWYSPAGTKRGAINNAII